MNKPTFRTVLQGTLVIGILLSASAASAANVACGAVIDGDSVVLDGPVGPCAGTAVQVKNGGTLDLGGYNIDCDGSMFTVGVVVDNGSTLKNGSVSGCEFSGVQVTGASGSTVTNVSSGFNGGDGFTVYASGTSTLSYNSANSNGGNGFTITTGPHRLIGNSAFQNSNGYQVTSDGVTLSSNRSTGNLTNGFNIVGNNAMLKTNSSANEQFGFVLTGNDAIVKGGSATETLVALTVAGDGAKVSKFSSSMHSGYGISVGGSDVTITACRAIGHPSYSNVGIVMGNGTTGNTFKKNVTAGNLSDLNVDTDGCGDSVWSGNIGQSNNPCIQ